MKNLTGRHSRAAVEISIADIRKQPSPVTVTTCRPGSTRCAPSAAGIDQPMLWLSVGLKKVRGRHAVKTSAAQYWDTVTSTKHSASAQLQRRSQRRNRYGSTP